MRLEQPSNDLEKSRARIVSKVRALRLERRWKQAELAAKLGLSQARLSEIERGGGSLTAEQLIAVLHLFNVSLDEFVGERDVQEGLQNALARLGALHLREVSGAVPSERVAAVRVAIRETLLSPTDARLILALAPVLVTNIDVVNLDVLHDELTSLGFPSRVPWLVANVHEALRLEGDATERRVTARRRRALVVLGDFMARHAPDPNGTPRRDHLDPGIRTKRTLDKVWADASGISRERGVISELQPADFADALRAALAGN